MWLNVDKVTEHYKSNSLYDNNDFVFRQSRDWVNI